MSLIFLAIPDLGLPTVSPGSASLTTVNTDPETHSHISCLSLLLALSSCIRQIPWFTLLPIHYLIPSLNYMWDYQSWAGLSYDSYRHLGLCEAYGPCCA